MIIVVWVLRTIIKAGDPIQSTPLYIICYSWGSDKNMLSCIPNKSESFYFQVCIISLWADSCWDLAWRRYRARIIVTRLLNDIVLHPNSCSHGNLAGLLLFRRNAKVSVTKIAIIYIYIYIHISPSPSPFLHIWEAVQYDNKRTYSYLTEIWHSYSVMIQRQYCLSLGPLLSFLRTQVCESDLQELASCSSTAIRQQRLGEIWQTVLRLVNVTITLLYGCDAWTLKADIS